MRITLAMNQQTTLRDINNNSEDVNRLISSISTGKKLSKAADDPSAWAQAMDLKQGMREYDTINSNMDFVTTWDNTTDSALNQLNNLVTQAKNAAIQAQGVDSEESRSSLAQKVDDILTQALQLAGTKSGDRYVFSGLKDPSPLQPYTIDASGVATYNGDSNTLQVRTGTGASNNETINLTGPEVFDFTDSTGTSANLLEKLYNLKQAITSGNTATIGAIQDDLDLAYQNVSNCQSKVGLQLAAIEQKQSALSTIKLNNSDTVSNLEDADLADAITQLQTKQTAFEASLQVTGMLSKLNLTQYV